MDEIMLKAESFIIIAAVLAASVSIYYFGPSITGFIIKESGYSDELNLVIASSGNHTWQPAAPGELKSVKISGSITTYGSARVYLENNGKKYLLFDSAKLNETKNLTNESANIITGFAVINPEESDKEKKEKNKKPKWNGQNEFLVNKTAIINLSQYFTDDDNETLVYSASGVEGLEISLNNGIAAMTVESETDFNATIDFTASDGIDAKTETAALVVIAEKEDTEGNASSNTAPRWSSGANSFVVNATLSIDLREYFEDDENDALAFSTTDSADFDEVVEGSMLNLSAKRYDFNSTLEITASDGMLNASKEISLVVLPWLSAENAAQNETANETEEKTISMNLEYKSGTVYDANDNGEESVNGVVDLSVEDTGFGWDVNESSLCTRWELYSYESDLLTNFCNGNEKCCSFAGLLPRESAWDATYYSTFGKDGAGYSNIVSAQVVYYDVDLNFQIPTSEIYYSGWGNLSVKFFEEETKFFSKCVETCFLSGLNRSSYNLVFEIEDDAILRINRIDYVMAADAQNKEPLLYANISDVNMTMNGNATINLSQHFADEDGDILAYSYYKPDNITIFFENDTATVVPDKGFSGSRFTYIIANDSENIAVSNVFGVNVQAPLYESGANGLVIQDANGSTLAIFDSNGNLRIKGFLIENTEFVPDSNDFAIGDASGGFKLVIANPEGNVFIKEALNRNLEEITATPNSFIIQDSTRRVVSYVNSTGSLFLSGNLIEGADFGYNQPIK